MLGIKYFEIYAWASCSWCARAVNLLKQNGLEFSLTLMDNSATKHHEMKKATGWETVPIVIEHSLNKDPELIGGFTDLVEHLRNQYGIGIEGEE
jgi:glutaredoxin